MKRFFTSCFGLGRLPFAPGTWGSIPVAAIFVILDYSGISPAIMAIAMGAMVLAGSIICVKFASAAMEATGKNDPGEVVIDEFAGQAVTFMISVIITSRQIWVVALLGFLFFRFFDIFKPWPVRNLEKLNAGWGILADDLAAGFYAAITLLLFDYSGLLNYIS